jgi:tetratricopeptide (TPR) repeat protein
LLSAALIDPTDNSLAQAEWSVERGINIENVEQFSAPYNYEAMARFHYRLENFDQALAYGMQLFTSFVAATLVEDQSIAIQACELGLKMNRGNPMLLNNLAFSLANRGEFRKAAEIIYRPLADVSPLETAIITATRGLIAFRAGEASMGRDMYRQAVESLIREKQLVPAASASLFWLYEELYSRGGGLMEALDCAIRTNTAARGPEIILSRRRLAKLVTEGNPSGAAEVVAALDLGRELR